MRTRLKIGKRAKQSESLALEDPILQETKTLGGLSLGRNRKNKSKPPNGNKGKHAISVGNNTLAHAKALRANVLGVVIWVTRSPITQRPHGITKVILRDPE